MQYLEERDYSVFCDDFERRVISENPEDWDRAETMAIELVGSYLRGRYDYDRMISIRCDKNPMVVQAIVSIALWNLVHRLPQSMGYERRQPMYDEAILWLKDVQAGRCSVNLPKYNEGKETDTHNPTRYGSLPPNKYNY